MTPVGEDLAVPLPAAEGLWRLPGSECTGEWHVPAYIVTPKNLSYSCRNSITIRGADIPSNGEHCEDASSAGSRSRARRAVAVQKSRCRPESPAVNIPLATAQNGEHGPIDKIRSVQSARCLSSSSRRRQVVTKGEPLDISDVPPTPITHMSETEAMMADAVSKFAQDVILPKVRDMDEAEKMDPAVVEQLFEQGLMGVEIPEEYGGAGMNFAAAIVAIEELARVDPSVSVMCDVHNTLVNTAIIKYGTEELKRKWLPKLATDTVGRSPSILQSSTILGIRSI
jgi:hypothetical protein